MAELGNVASSVTEGAATGASGFAFGPIAGMATTILGAILGGFGAAGQSPQEKATGKVLDKLEGLEDFFKELPFSKEEIMKELLPQAQAIYRGAADVVAGKVGAQAGESGVAGGQSAREFYLQSIAPVIAQGEQLAGDAVGEFSQFFAGISQQQKGNLLNLFRTELSATGGLPEMDQFQRTILGAFGGAKLGANVAGDVSETFALGEEADIIRESLKRLKGG